MQKSVFFSLYYGIIKKNKRNNRDGVMVMSVVAGVLVCAFVYVIRVSLVPPGDEEFRTY